MACSGRAWAKKVSYPRIPFSCYKINKIHWEFDKVSWSSYLYTHLCLYHVISMLSHFTRQSIDVYPVVVSDVLLEGV